MNNKNVTGKNVFGKEYTFPINWITFISKVDKQLENPEELKKLGKYYSVLAGGDYYFFDDETSKEIIKHVQHELERKKAIYDLMLEEIE